MGFLESFVRGLGTVVEETVNTANKKVQDQQQRIERYADHARRLDDKTLIERYKNETDATRKYAYAIVLKERGYGK